MLSIRLNAVPEVANNSAVTYPFASPTTFYSDISNGVVESIALSPDLSSPIVTQTPCYSATHPYANIPRILLPAVTLVKLIDASEGSFAPGDPVLLWPKSSPSDTTPSRLLDTPAQVDPITRLVAMDYVTYNDVNITVATPGESPTPQCPCGSLIPCLRDAVGNHIPITVAIADVLADEEHLLGLLRRCCRVHREKHLRGLTGGSTSDAPCHDSSTDPHSADTDVAGHCRGVCTEVCGRVQGDLAHYQLSVARYREEQRKAEKERKEEEARRRLLAQDLNRRKNKGRRRERGRMRTKDSDTEGDDDENNTKRRGRARVAAKIAGVGAQDGFSTQASALAAAAVSAQLDGDALLAALLSLVTHVEAHARAPLTHAQPVAETSVGTCANVEVAVPDASDSAYGITADSMATTDVDINTSTRASVGATADACGSSAEDEEEDGNEDEFTPLTGYAWCAWGVRRPGSLLLWRVQHALRYLRQHRRSQSFLSLHTKVGQSGTDTTLEHALPLTPPVPDGVQATEWEQYLSSRAWQAAVRCRDRESVGAVLRWACRGQRSLYRAVCERYGAEDELCERRSADGQSVVMMGDEGEEAEEDEEHEVIELVSEEEEEEEDEDEGAGDEDEDEDENVEESADRPTLRHRGRKLKPHLAAEHMRDRSGANDGRLAALRLAELSKGLHGAPRDGATGAEIVAGEGGQAPARAVHAADAAYASDAWPAFLSACATHFGLSTHRYYTLVPLPRYLLPRCEAVCVAHAPVDPLARATACNVSLGTSESGESENSSMMFFPETIHADICPPNPALLRSVLRRGVSAFTNSAHLSLRDKPISRLCSGSETNGLLALPTAFRANAAYVCELPLGGGALVDLNEAAMTADYVWADAQSTCALSDPIAGIDSLSALAATSVRRLRRTDASMDMALLVFPCVDVQYVQQQHQYASNLRALSAAFVDKLHYCRMAGGEQVDVTWVERHVVPDMSCHDIVTCLARYGLLTHAGLMDQRTRITSLHTAPREALANVRKLVQRLHTHRHSLHMVLLAALRVTNHSWHSLPAPSAALGPLGDQYARVLAEVARGEANRGQEEKPEEKDIEDEAFVHNGHVETAQANAAVDVVGNVSAAQASHATFTRTVQTSTVTPAQDLKAPAHIPESLSPLYVMAAQCAGTATANPPAHAPHAPRALPPPVDALPSLPTLALLPSLPALTSLSSLSTSTPVVLLAGPHGIGKRYVLKDIAARHSLHVASITAQDTVFLSKLSLGRQAHAHTAHVPALLTGATMPTHNGRPSPSPHLSSVSCILLSNTQAQLAHAGAQTAFERLTGHSRNAAHVHESMGTNAAVLSADSASSANLPPLSALIPTTYAPGEGALAHLQRAVQQLARDNAGALLVLEDGDILFGNHPEAAENITFLHWLREKALPNLMVVCICTSADRLHSLARPAFAHMFTLGTPDSSRRPLILRACLDALTHTHAAEPASPTHASTLAQSVALVSVGASHRTLDDLCARMHGWLPAHIALVASLALQHAKYDAYHAHSANDTVESLFPSPVVITDAHIAAAFSAVAQQHAQHNFTIPQTLPALPPMHPLMAPIAQADALTAPLHGVSLGLLRAHISVCGNSVIFGHRAVCRQLVDVIAGADEEERSAHELEAVTMSQGSDSPGDGTYEPVDGPLSIATVATKSGCTGILLHGPSGCGKSLLARAISGNSGCSIFEITPATLLNSGVGESEKILSGVFAEAVRCAPSIIFFDDISALFGASDANADSDGSESLLSQLLILLDRLYLLAHSSTTQRLAVRIVATAAHPAHVHPALLRPGRLDMQLHVGLPSRPERVSALAYMHALLQCDVTTDVNAASNACAHKGDANLNGDFDLALLGKLTGGLSHAELLHLYSHLRVACAHNDTAHTSRMRLPRMQDWLEAIRHLKMQKLLILNASG